MDQLIFLIIVNFLIIDIVDQDILIISIQMINIEVSIKENLISV